MTPRRLLVVTDEMEVGGSQRQIVHLLLGLDRSRWQPTLLYFRRRSFLVDELEASGIRCIHLPKQGRISVGFVWRLWKLLRHERFELIHAYSLTAELWVRALLPLLPRTRYIASVRGLCLIYPDWQWRIKRWILGRSDAVISNAKAGAQVTADRTGYRVADIDIVPNGIDLPELIPSVQRAAARRMLGVTNGRIAALFVGRLVVEKNLPLLVEAMALLEPSRRPLLLIAGDGPLAPALDLQIAAAGIAGDVIRLGERSDTRLLMQAADFLVLPSSEEGLSNVVLEAMSAGLAVLASDVGGNPELIDDGVSGWLFPSGDAQTLAMKLQALAEQADLRRTLGSKARAQAQRYYSIPALVSQTETIYERVLMTSDGHNRASS